MDKQEILRNAMQNLRGLLIQGVLKDAGLNGVYERFLPIFREIENGDIEVPCGGKYFQAFNIESERYADGHPIVEAVAHFWSALEDWPSKPWYPR